MITKSKKIIQTQRKIRIFPHESHEKPPFRQVPPYFFIRLYSSSLNSCIQFSQYIFLFSDKKFLITGVKLKGDSIKYVRYSFPFGFPHLRFSSIHNPYTSHFYIAQELEPYLGSLELNFFISKYNEMSNKSGKKVSIYALNYGLLRSF